MFGGKENSECKTDRERSEIGRTKPEFSEMGAYKLRKIEELNYTTESDNLEV